MFSGIGSLELLTIGVVALIIIGPKDLPVVFHRIGQFVGRVRGMARDFQSAMSEAARESGLDEVKDSMQGATNTIAELNRMGKGDMSSTAKSFHKKYLKPQQEAAKAAGKAVGKSASKSATKTVSKAGGASGKVASGGAARKVVKSSKRPAAKSAVKTTVKTTKKTRAK